VSLLWRERVEVGFYPDRLVVSRAKGEQTLAVPPAESQTSRWQSALDALAGLEAVSRAEVTVVLSSFFVRYTLVPLSEALTSTAERLAFARHCLARIHGPAAEGWTVRLSGEVACGVDAQLVEGLRSTLAARANRFRSLHPRLMAAFNRCRRKLGSRATWFVDVEPGLASLALLQNGCWQSLRSVKVGPRWQEELPALLAREACFVDSPADCQPVIHAFS
jgi:hypothetical protein